MAEAGFGRGEGRVGDNCGAEGLPLLGDHAWPSVTSAIGGSALAAGRRRPCCDLERAVGAGLVGLDGRRPGLAGGMGESGGMSDALLPLGLAENGEDEAERRPRRAGGLGEPPEGLVRPEAAEEARPERAPSEGERSSLSSGPGDWLGSEDSRPQASPSASASVGELGRSCLPGSCLGSCGTGRPR